MAADSPHQLVISFLNTSSVNQEWGFLQRNVNVPPKGQCKIKVTTTGDQSIGFTVTVNEEEIGSALRYTYQTNAWTLWPGSQYLQLGSHQLTAGVRCNYAGQSIAANTLNIVSLTVTPSPNEE
ncbi:hypothetical protein KJE20_14345 [Pyrenophora tritici-repentis]|uniref:Uncharacterized protein n=1 Tax=Cochliobolus carbonum (strain 26-R-13) TaxID=930089 RepID=W6Y0F3_COCC2|nr:uncharacterized protein COCCADRAFT_30273 [Bipolaris zeicola 26-R-13]EUC28469.1 hypothetical protein COCCADRAFT_30273 [Bipolaris zeicola 26-R-13]KAI1676073.1 hypothetical protein KJE20_14345 [Pyrenophora tritici-repentis]